MANVNIENDKLVISMNGARKLWTLKSELSIPLNGVISICADSNAWQNTPKFGQKRLGTDAYGFYFGGKFAQDGNKIFYDLAKNENAVIISLKHEDFDYLIIGVDNPDDVIEMVNTAIHKAN